MKPQPIKLTLDKVPHTVDIGNPDTISVHYASGILNPLQVAVDFIAKEITLRLQDAETPLTATLKKTHGFVEYQTTHGSTLHIKHYRDMQEWMHKEDGHYKMIAAALAAANTIPSQLLSHAQRGLVEAHRAALAAQTAQRA